MRSFHGMFEYVLSIASSEKLPEAQNPLLLRSYRLMDAFSKSDDERDFHLDRVEGFIVYVDLDGFALA